MTISTTVSSVTLQGDGANKTWSYSFLIPSEGEVIVTVTKLADSTTTTIAPGNYSISGIGNPAGGIVTYPTTGAAIAIGYSITIQRVLPLTQTLNLTSQGDFNPISIEDELDDLVMIMQQLQEQLNRVVTFPVGTLNLDADQLIQDIFSAQGYATAAAADATAAAGSATAAATSASDAAASAAALKIGGRCKLSYVSTTQIKLSPYDGNTIVINGVAYGIPAAGITAANTSTYVNGTAGQNLASNTVYNVYVFNNGGTLTLDFSTTAHATSSTAGNIGVEVKSGDNTRSLVGKIKTSGTNFADNILGNATTAGLISIINWFNRQPIRIMNGNSANVNTVSTPWVNISNSLSTAITWAGPYHMIATSVVNSDTAGGTTFLQCVVDGVSVGMATEFQSPTVAYVASVTCVANGTLSETSHTFGLVGGSNGVANAAYFLGYTGFILTIIG